MVSEKAIYDIQEIHHLINKITDLLLEEPDYRTMRDLTSLTKRIKKITEAYIK